MIPATDYSQVWMSPYFAITRLRTIGEKYGIKVALTDGRFKKEREAMAAACLSFALSKFKDDQFYIEIETVDNTPDIKLHNIDQSSGHNSICTRCIEVVDWEDHVPDVMEVIRKKCARPYPKDYSLLVNLRNTRKLLNFATISKEMKAIQSPFAETWLAGFGGFNKLSVARVSPGLLEFSLDYLDEMQKAEHQPPTLKRGIRGTGTEFYPLGYSFLPIP
jgi:hypothetical protein